MKGLIPETEYTIEKLMSSNSPKAAIFLIIVIAIGFIIVSLLVAWFAISNIVKENGEISLEKAERRKSAINIIVISTLLFITFVLKESVVTSINMFEVSSDSIDKIIQLMEDEEYTTVAFSENNEDKNSKATLYLSIDEAENISSADTKYSVDTKYSSDNLLLIQKNTEKFKVGEKYKAIIDEKNNTFLLEISGKGTLVELKDSIKLENNNYYEVVEKKEDYVVLKYTKQKGDD